MNRISKGPLTVLKTHSFFGFRFDKKTAVCTIVTGYLANFSDFRSSLHAVNA